MLYWLVALSILGGIVGLIIYLYFLREGQFDDQESTKYQIFREDDPDN